MPLDPALEAILRLMALQPEITSYPPPQARVEFAKGAHALQAPRPLPKVGSTEDLTVGDNPIRVYRPVKDNVRRIDGRDIRPLVVFVHGGGWTIGSLDTHDDHARRLCRDLQAVVVSVEYRLAPEHPFPAAVDDVTAGFDWTIDHLDELGGDPDRLAVAGDSAGGNLAAVLAQHARDTGTTLRAQLLLYPATDLTTRYASLDENAEGYFLTREAVLWFSRNYVGTDGLSLGDPRLSPLRAATLAGLAPAVVVTAELDPIRDDGEAYASALTDAGVQVVRRRFEGIIHGFYGMGAVSPACEDAIVWTNAEFKKLLV